MQICCFITARKTMFFFQNVLKGYSFQNICTGMRSFLYYQDSCIFVLFLPIWYYPTVKKAKMIFFRKNARKDVIYSITKIYDICVSSDGKIKDDKKLQWESCNDFLCFYGEIYSCFHTLLFNEIKAGDLICSIKFYFFFKLYAWRHSTMKNIQYSIPFTSQELYLRVWLSGNQETLFFIRSWIIILKTNF